MSGRCTDAYAKSTANDLDSGKAHEAAQKLYECSSEELQRLGYDRSKLQYFAERVSELEKKGNGLDLTL